MPLRADLTAKVGKAFTRVWNRLEGASSITLLRASDNYDEYDDLLTLESKWFFEYSNFRKSFLLEIADDTPELTGILGNSPDEITATHIRVGDEVYVIREGDTTPPFGTDVTWKVYCDAVETSARFTSLR